MVFPTNANNIGEVLYFAVEEFDRIGEVQLGAMLIQKGHLGQSVLFCVVHDVRKAWYFWADLIGDCAPLGAGSCGCRLGKGCDIALKMNPTALPLGAQNLYEGYLEPRQLALLGATHACSRQHPVHVSSGRCMASQPRRQST
ncbi:hypothetical protein P775_24880 [Puniceibacterium antarcticum]|uniref:Uncharacterized protein n=1 Tax=Puniceibacterium antarcticum TaxID=1206336 RepID=A0A2G8R6K2_9RHOB|nr:hypothetical protein [Puniceibacterium antarcticum]PIL17164.1 hypothetical protein P775_24880 [Puniceibacterium antarcticum]